MSHLRRQGCACRLRGYHHAHELCVMGKNKCAGQTLSLLPSRHIDIAICCKTYKHLPRNHSLFRPHPSAECHHRPWAAESSSSNVSYPSRLRFSGGSLRNDNQIFLLLIPNVVDTYGPENSTEAWSSVSFPSQRHHMCGVKRQMESRQRQYKALHYRLTCLRGVLQSEFNPKPMRAPRWGLSMKKENVP